MATREYARAWYAKKVGRPVRTYRTTLSSEDVDERRARRRAEARVRAREAHLEDPRVRMHKAAMTRAKKLGLPFRISVEDIVIPDECPILKVPLVVDFKWRRSPALDRIIPELGYVPGNVWVISHWANMLKQNIAIDGLKVLLHKMEQAQTPT